MTTFESLFFEIHKNLPQEGPGSDESTLQALETIKALPHKPVVLDIGCGPGRQTLTLASKLSGEIYALDNHQPFLDALESRSKSKEVKALIKTVNALMDHLPFSREQFDLIWSEGAIYIIGMEKGLSYWRDFIKPRGFLALSELCWLKDPGNNDAWKFLSEGYPAMKSVEGNLSLMEKSGFKVLDHFILPPSDWFDNYYQPMLERIDELKTKYSADEHMLQFLESEKKEIRIFQEFSDYYGYVFFILQWKA